jgi:hypothetical protein
MADTRHILCGGIAPGRRSGEGPEPIQLAIGRGPRDVRLRLSQFSDTMKESLTPLFADLLELSSYVYVADQTATRGGTKSFDYGDRWHRDFHFKIPVRCPEVWNRTEVRESLCGLLGFLTDDQYEFEFLKAARPVALDRFLFDGVPPEETATFDELMLFSGGLDSLCGAVEEVLQGQRRALLVSHRPEGRIYARQQNLVNAIRSRLPNPRRSPFHFAAKVNKAKVHNREATQRSRSFLFASMAAVVARLFDLKRIRFYENGVTSLNLPISPQMLGGRTSRTTHPQTLWRFSQLFSLLFETEFTVENPFQWSTKPEILRRLAALKQADLCAATSSCVHTWDRSERHPHCGRCSQCVDRRMSVLAANVQQDDPNSGYESDVIVGECNGIDLAFVERYVGSAFDMSRIETSRRFAERFGEIAHVIRYTGLPADHAVQKIFELYRKHAEEVSQALQGIITSRSDAVMHQSYPVYSLLGAIVGRTSRFRYVGKIENVDSARDGIPTPVEKGLVIDSTKFEVRFDGVSCFLGNTLEFGFLARLQRARGIYVSHRQLQDDVWNDDHTERSAIQRVASNLRRKLKDAEIAGVTIDGGQAGHYRLVCSGS